MFEYFDHTADLGIRVRSADRNALFEEAAQALFGTIVENIEAVAPRESDSIAIEGTDIEYLLFDWIRELLYRFDADRRVYSRFEVRINATGLSAVAAGEPLDPDRHALGHEVKAITYHGLRVESTAAGWEAEFIVDI